MKHLILVRHAKSSWSDWSLDDFDRPLNKRGKRDAPFMAAQIKKLFPKVDLLLISPAKRAQLTAKEFKKQYPKAETSLVKKIYEASVRDLEEIVLEIEDRFDTVMMFGHNPAYTYFANKYVDTPFDNLPTCGIAVIQLRNKVWSDFDTSNALMTHLIYPKQFVR